MSFYFCHKAIYLEGIKTINCFYTSIDKIYWCKGSKFNCKQKSAC